MKVSNTRMFIEYILIAFSTYLILSLIISIIGGINYREVLTNYGQIFNSFPMWAIIYFLVILYIVVTAQDKR